MMKNRGFDNGHPLSDAEKYVILKKGTEKPFSGQYHNFKGKGLYLCRNCGMPLYRSSDKFESECGWPSFDAEISGAVKRDVDIDGIRTEITCSSCGAHLGHVFGGEKLTLKDVRHCVNSISMDFEPEKGGKFGRAFFAGGCFWGIEYLMAEETGVVSAVSGYMGGTKENPGYPEVCSGTTGHTETVELIFDREKTDFEILAKLFLEIHDPCQLNRQGPDIGEQYRSVIFYIDDEQRKTAEKLLNLLREKGFNPVTAIESAGKFWEAESFHQNYYQRKGGHPYCHHRKKRF
jgi:peptide methionine sulfoxide reductase msrA/msrB